MSDENQCVAEGGDLAALLKRIVRQVSDASYTQGIDERLDSPTRDEKNDSKVRALLGEASAAIDRLAALASKVQPKGTAKIDYRAECWPASRAATRASDDHGAKAYKMAKALADHLSVRPAPESQAPAVAPEIHIRCETECNGLQGSTWLNVIRVELEDDGSFTAVTDPWPQSTPRLVPLTTPQIIDATSRIDTTAPAWMVAIVRAIEQAHGIGESKPPVQGTQ